MIDFKSVITALSSRRPIFHSEADFQHALAWEIHGRLPNASVRLEYPISIANKILHLDFWAAQNGESVAVELKYKTRGFLTQVGGEQYTLTDQSAQDLGRYDFVKDIQRLEQIVASRKNAAGYAILITNDSAYWKQARDSHPVDADFRLDNGRTLHGELKWSVRASKGTIRSREAQITINGQYNLQWQDYSDLNLNGYSKFRYLVVCV